jgi:hypothetical protein
MDGANRRSFSVAAADDRKLRDEKTGTLCAKAEVPLIQQKNSGEMHPDRFVFSYSYIIILISTNSNTFQPLYFLLYCERKTFFFRSPGISLRAQANATPNNRKRLFTSKCAFIRFYILCNHAQRVHLEKSIIFFEKYSKKEKRKTDKKSLFFSRSCVKNIQLCK